MPKAKNSLTPEEQRKRFEEEVERLVRAGELDPEEADARIDGLVKIAARKSRATKQARG